MPESDTSTLDNPFRPGAGHMPPHLAGRQHERSEFERLLDQQVILENAILTGLRGVGKTVLLDTFKPLAMRMGWHWVGTDLSESASVTEEALAIRLLTDLSVVSSSLVLERGRQAGFAGSARDVMLDYTTLVELYAATPGLVADKLKHVLETVAAACRREGIQGVVFAYDEAQNLADAQVDGQFPLSLLLDVFQSIQKREIPFMLVLTGLPTLFPKLVDARTFAERMFRVIVLDKLDEEASRDAILTPLDEAGSALIFDGASVETICDASGGYPYFIQFICREAFDASVQSVKTSGRPTPVPLDAITRKLDTDFFAGRWARATDRQRELLWTIANLANADGEFTVQEIVDASKRLLPKAFGNSHVSQMLVTLIGAGLIYKNRWGRYSFAVPLFDRFILRQHEAAEAFGSA